MNEEFKQESEAPKEEQPAAKEQLKGLVARLEAFLDEYMVKKAPFVLPQNAKEFIVAIAPYLIILLAIMTLPLILAALGLSAILAPFALMAGRGYMHGWGIGSGIVFLFSMVALVIEIMAISGLFARTKRAWRLMFYASLVMLIGNILSVSGLVGGVIGAVIGWYILFQVKDLYKN